MMKHPQPEIDKRVRHAAKVLELDHLLERRISQLSGGQQQRVFLARALAQEADLYLMDEPFAGVDAATEAAILDILQGLATKGKTVVVVHHDLQSAANFFDWILLINMRLVASGPIDRVFTPDLLQETYGGKLTVLAEVGDLIAKRQMPSREKY
jgi:manganese/zinc/iron transport system ATP- binding protein